MKIAIVSDSHDNWTTTEKALRWLKKKRVGSLIHCGDVCSPSMLKEMSRLFRGEIHLVFGNVDGDPYSMLKAKEKGELPNVVFHGDAGELNAGGKKMAFCHKPLPAQGLSLSGKYDLVFYGHTHQPWEEKVGNCRVVNPGTLAGLFSKATFAVYDTKTDKLELKLVEKL
ncbi:MAG: YfcE family phosphodiesterase [Candidatus Nealsonbacteria bacterium]|nr:YfcE family phosphodiesterase [Candidatus Nealsonbacteria bacterium]